MKDKIIEHASNDSRFSEERKAVFLSGFYSLLEADIKKLDLYKVLTPKTEEDENV